MKKSESLSLGSNHIENLKIKKVQGEPIYHKAPKGEIPTVLGNLKKRG